MVPEDLRYSSEHEWLRLAGNEATVGITDYAQQELGDVVYVSLPKVGSRVGFMQKFGEVESVKVASELFCPVSGEVVGSNEALDAAPELVNSDPFGEGWMIRVRLENASEIENLLTSQGYRDLIRQEQGH